MSLLYLTPADSLQSAFDRALPGDHIHLGPGEYRQKCVIRTPRLLLTGEGADRTRIVYGDYARKLHRDGLEYNTFRTFSLAVCADEVRIKGLSVVNDAFSPEKKGQEVALSVLGDQLIMEDSLLSSTQDTLFAGPLPPDLILRYDSFLPDELRRGAPLSQLYRNCLIKGTVDFIFGCGDARFLSCEIRSLLDARGKGYAAAPAHSLAQQEGFVFEDCRFTCEEGVADGSIFLARPWRDYGLSEFRNCQYGPHITPEGFDPWQGTERDKTARFFETPAREGRVPWINR